MDIPKMNGATVFIIAYQAMINPAAIAAQKPNSISKA